MSILRRTLCILWAATFVLATAQRLPAPIVEEQQKPTAAPAPEQSETPRQRTKHLKSKSSSESESSPISEARAAPALQGLPRFAGVWVGRINQGAFGRPAATLSVDAGATSVELSKNVGGGKHASTLKGNTISWKSGLVNEVFWTLTPNADGQTAQVTLKGILASDSTTFSRGRAGHTPSSEAPETTAQPAATSTSELSSAASGTITGPRPVYSQAARDRHLSGTGTFVLHFDTATGSVTNVTVQQSTGSAVLNQAAIDAFRQWHEQPNGKKEFTLTISFP